MYTTISAQAAAERSNRLILEAELFRTSTASRSGRRLGALRTIGAVQNPSGPARPYARPLAPLPSMPTVSQSVELPAQPSALRTSAVPVPALAPAARGWAGDDDLDALLAVELERGAAAGVAAPC